jgi:Tfp pilus assembly protein PilN
MLRTNLATRPFYNERAIHIALAAAAIVVLAITFVNVSRIVTLSRRNTELSSRTDADRAEASRLSTEAARIRRSINKDELALVVNAAQEANALIDQRTFSWTEFFNQIESTIPPDVMLTSVRPSFKDGVTSVTMMVKARQNADIDEFMEKLEATGLFENVLAPSSESTEDGLWRATVEGVYVSKAAAADEPPAASPAAPSKSPPSPAAPEGKRVPPKSAAPIAQTPRDRGRK